MPHSPDYAPEYARAHPRESFALSRKYDAMDIFSVSLEFPALGAKAILGPIEAGLFVNSVNGGHVFGQSRAGGMGLRSGYMLYESAENVFIVSLIDRKTVFQGTDGIGERKDLYNVRDYSFGRAGAELGACLGLRIEVNFLELVDFFAGFFSFDFLKDDLKPFPRPLEITTLRLESSNLTEISPGFSEYKNLRHLSLGNNKLETIPEEFGKLTQLETLRLHSNQIRTLPNVMSNLKKLQLLDLASNKLSDLGTTLCGMDGLRTLDLKLNKLEKFPSIECLGNLKDLDLSYNAIKEIPESIGQMKGLQSINMFDTDIEKLPASIGELTELRVLDLRKRNGPPVHPVDSIRNLKKLYQVRIGFEFKDGRPDEESRQRYRTEWKKVLPPDCDLSY